MSKVTAPAVGELPPQGLVLNISVSIPVVEMQVGHASIEYENELTGGMPLGTLGDEVVLVLGGRIEIEFPLYSTVKLAPI